MPRATSVRCDLEETLNNSLLTLFNNILGALRRHRHNLHFIEPNKFISCSPCRELGLVNKICGVCRKGISASACRQLCFRQFNSMGLHTLTYSCVFLVSREKRALWFKEIVTRALCEWGEWLDFFRSRAVCVRRVKFKCAIVFLGWNTFIAVTEGLRVPRALPRSTLVTIAFRRNPPVLPHLLHSLVTHGTNKQPLTDLHGIF